jgi:hypothetical protein
MKKEELSSQPPDFRNWTTRRLQFLLEEYQSVLKNCRPGKKDPIYENWIASIQRELKSRN